MSPAPAPRAGPRLDSGGLPRLLAGVDRRGRAANAIAHERVYGPMPKLSRDQLIAEVSRSGLRGRGGADFPTARKLAAVAKRRSVSAVVVNGSETEPGSEKDRVLMVALPHLVLDGALAAAAAVGAHQVIVKLGPRGGDAALALQDALDERRPTVPVSIVQAGGGYVSGEESAVINAISGGPPIPTAVPPRPFERGYRGKPTLVQNPETLAQLALIARFGADWFRQLGTRADPGTVLTTISGAVAVPGVYELAFGTPLRELLDAAGGPTEPIQAFLVGGYFGTWVRWEDTHNLCLAREQLAATGLALGSGVLIALGRSACGLHESARLARYLADQSAGQCGPCVHGLAAISEAFTRLVERGATRAEREQIVRWADEVRGRGACHHPNGAARLILSSLDTFGADMGDHAGGRCHARPAGLPGTAGTAGTAGDRNRSAGRTR